MKMLLPVPAALRFNVASGNTAVGHTALFSNRFGHYNTSLADSALNSNTVGEENTGVGWLAMYYNNIGFSNRAVDVSALNFNTTGLIWGADYHSLNPLLCSCVSITLPAVS